MEGYACLLVLSHGCSWGTGVADGDCSIPSPLSDHCWVSSVLGGESAFRRELSSVRMGERVLRHKRRRMGLGPLYSHSSRHSAEHDDRGGSGASPRSASCEECYDDNSRRAGITGGSAYSPDPSLYIIPSGIGLRREYVGGVEEHEVLGLRNAAAIARERRPRSSEWNSYRESGEEGHGILRAEKIFEELSAETSRLPRRPEGRGLTSEILSDHSGFELGRESDGRGMFWVDCFVENERQPDMETPSKSSSEKPEKSPTDEERRKRDQQAALDRSEIAALRTYKINAEADFWPLMIFAIIVTAISAFTLGFVPPVLLCPSTCANGVVRFRLGHPSGDPPAITEPITVRGESLTVIASCIGSGEFEMELGEWANGKFLPMKTCQCIERCDCAITDTERTSGETVVIGVTHTSEKRSVVYCTGKVM